MRHWSFGNRVFQKLGKGIAGVLNVYTEHYGTTMEMDIFKNIFLHKRLLTTAMI